MAITNMFLLQNQPSTACLFSRGSKMKLVALLTLILLTTILFLGCAVPDLPGPIGIPGL